MQRGSESKLEGHRCIHSSNLQGNDCWWFENLGF